VTDVASIAMQDNLIALRERKRLLDDVWLLALFVLFLAIGVPWYLRILEINFAPVAWSLFGFGLIYVLTTSAADRLRSHRSLVMVLGSLQAAGVLFIGFVWHLTGSLQNPLFLLAFVLPVVAASLVLVHWQSYATVLLSVATVLTVALMDAPELRWYVTQAGSLAQWLIGLLPRTSASAAQPFPGLNTPPAYLFMLLLLFAVLLFTVALMTESVTSLLLRLSGRLEAATKAASVAEDLSSEVLRVSPTPAAIVYTDTLKIAQASQSFLHHLFVDPKALLDRNLFDLVEFAYPEVIENLITGNGGEVPLAVYTVHGETRVAEVRVNSILYGGRRYAYVNIQDISDLHYLEAALNSLDDALLVLSPTPRILHCNQAAKDLLGDLQPGADAAAALAQANLPNGWWELGQRSRQERRFELNGRRIAATCVAARLPGEREAHTVLMMHSLEGEQ